MAESKRTRDVVEYPPKYKDKPTHRAIYIYWAVPEDVDRIIEIERSAGELFREIGMDPVADDEPPPPEQLVKSINDNGILLASDDPSLEAPPTAYLSMEIDHDRKILYLAQVSVDKGYTRRGIGERLMDHLVAYAQGRGLIAIVLTTFKDVSWNGPYYQRLGFHELGEEELKLPGNQIAANHLDQERRWGTFDKWPRIAMRRNISIEQDE